MAAEHGVEPDAAAAVTVSPEGGFAAVKSVATVSSPFDFRWACGETRGSEDARFAAGEFVRTVVEACRRACGDAKPARLAVAAWDERAAGAVADALGLRLCDTLLSSVGYAGAAQPLLVLERAFEGMRPGESLLWAGGVWRLTGRKMWVTNGTSADFFTVAASVDPSQGLKGLRFFFVEKGAQDLCIGKRIEKMGLRGSETTELALDDCPAVKLGDAGVGELSQTLDQVRTMTGALAVGVSRAALDDAVRYAGERVCFNQPIAKFQAIQHRLADAAVDLEASRLFVYQAGRMIERGHKASQAASIAKLFASEAANRIADHAARILGGYGLAMEYAAQRYLRDARFLLIGGGTSEILRNVIARELIG